MTQESNTKQKRKYLSPENACPEHELVAGLRARERSYQTYLFEHYKEALLGDLLYKFAVLGNEAEIVMVDSFMKAYEKIDSYSEEKGKLFTWILNISRNTAIDKVRYISLRSGIRTSCAVDERYTQISGTDPVDPSLDMFTKWVMKHCSEVDGEILRLHYYEGMAHQEIADVMKLPLGTVKTKIRSTLIRIRGIIKEKDIRI